MKYMKMAFGLAIVAGLMAMAASSATALEPRWVTCVKAKTGEASHWTEPDCLTAGPEGGWNTKGFAENETIESTSSGTLKLEDRKTKTKGEKVTIECSGTNQGWVGPNGQAEITRVTASACKFVNKEHGGCEEAAEPTAEPLNLPWSLHLTEIGGRVRVLLRSLVANKTPGWNVKCRVGGIFKVSDECTGNSNVGVESARSNLLTNFIFDSTSEEEPANCTLGEGEKTGFVKGTVSSSIRNKNGELQALWVLAAAFHT